MNGMFGTARRIQNMKAMKGMNVTFEFAGRI